MSASRNGPAKGKLIGVGVGPGDPELMTLKAHRLIATAEVIAYPAPETDGITGESFARQIAANAIPSDVIEIPIVIPMRSKRFPAQDVYDGASHVIRAHLDAGRNVITLCEGDPFFYGSFMYLFARLAGDYPTEIVPGVTSMTACAAAAARPLCARNETLTALPAPRDLETLNAHLASGQPLAIMKVGRHLPALKVAIAKAGLTDRATYVSHASLPHQVVAPLADAPDTAPYFSMILISGTDPHGTR